MGGGLAMGLTACASFPFAIGSPDTVPRWDPAATQPVLTQEWLDGFVAPADWNVDTVRIYGDGRWEAERTYSAEAGKPPVMVASGSLSADAMKTLLGTVFVKAEDGKRFVDLPERVESGITDIPTLRIAVSIQNASHSVTAPALTSIAKPPAFTRVAQEMASRTVAVPFPD